MNKWVLGCLFVILAASLLLNGYLWLSLNHAVGFASNDKHAANLRDNATGELTSWQHLTRKQSNSDTTDSAKNRHEDGVSQAQINQLNHLLSTSDYNLLKQQLNQALQRFPDHEGLLLLEAEWVLRTQPLSEALIHFHDLAELPLTRDAKEQVKKRIKSLYTNAHKELTANSQWDLLANLSEPLFQRVPDNRRYILALAEAYARQQKLTLMEDVLASLAYDDSDANTIRALAFNETHHNNDTSSDHTASSNEFLGQDITRVALVRDRDQYRVGVRVLDQEAELVLDTGASTVAISTDLFNRLGGLSRLTFIGNFDVNTASGTINASMVHIPNFYFAGYRFNEVTSLVLPADALPNVDGLLGMNILGKFDFSISPQDNELTLKIREKTRR